MNWKQRLGGLVILGLFLALFHFISWWSGFESAVLLGLAGILTEIITGETKNE